MKHSFSRRDVLVMGLAGAAAGLLAGCSASSGQSTGAASTKSTDTSGQTLNYWLWVDDPTDQTWQQLADEFNAQSGHGKVNLQVVPAANYLDKLQTAISSGSGPDAARMKDEWIGQFVKAGVVASLTSRVNSWSGKSTVIDSAWNSGKIPGSDNIYMLPHQNVALYMYANKSLLDAAGVQIPTTQAEVLAAAPKLTSGKHYAMDVRGGSGGQDQWAGWMYAGGSKFVDSSGKVTLENSTAEKVNQMYLDMAKYAPPGSATALFAQVESNFLSGTTALLIHHVGSLAAVRKQFGDNAVVIPIPAADPSKPSTLQTDSGNVILQTSKQQELAWQWGTWLLADAPMLKMSTSPQGQLPVTTAISQNAFFTKDPGYQVAIKAEQTAQSWPQLDGTTNVVNATWSPTIQEAFAGQISSKQMLQTLSADLAK